jgi:hypothetical protein
MAIWKASEFDETELIRSIVTAPEFHEKSSNEGFVRTSNVSLKVWKNSVLAVLNLRRKKTFPLSRDESFLQKSLFLETLLSQRDLDSKEVDWEIIWPRALGRRIAPAESEALDGLNAKDIYHSLFLSDDFSRIY